MGSQGIGESNVMLHALTSYVNSVLIQASVCCPWCVCVCVYRRVCQQLSESRELCTQLQDLEKDLSTRLTSMEEGKQQLQQQYSDAQAKISSLSQVCMSVCEGA